MRLKCPATKTGYILLVAVVVLCVMWSFYSNKKDSFLFSFLDVFLLLSRSRWAPRWLGWFWPPSNRSSAAQCHQARGPGSVSVAIREPDRRCPVSAAGPKSSLPPWIFHLWILQNQCSVFAFPDRDHGSAFSFATPHLFLLCSLSACNRMCFLFSLIFSMKHMLILPLPYPAPPPLPPLHFCTFLVPTV